jgi:hypothetical protein
VGYGALRGLANEAENLAQNRATKAVETREQAAHQAVIPSLNARSLHFYQYNIFARSNDFLDACVVPTLSTMKVGTMQFKSTQYNYTTLLPILLY